MKRVTGIGGIFFKTPDPESTRNWYAKHLGLNTNEYGSLFESKSAVDESTQYLQWSPFTHKTEYFGSPKQEFMINYRVADIENLVKALKEEGVKILDSIEEFEYGKFVHIEDLDGIKIQLWEPVDQIFTRDFNDQTTK